METVVRDKPADLEVITVFANAVFESCPDYGLTWWELSHCEELDYDSPNLYTVYRNLAVADLLELIPVSSTRHAVNATNSGESLHPGVRVIRITEKGMKHCGKLVSKEMKTNK